MMGSEKEGFDEAIEELEELGRRAEALGGENKVSPAELFPPGFMRRHTDFESFEAMLESSPWKVESGEDFITIPDGEWDDYVAANTRFDTWQKMQETAMAKWSERQLGLE